MGGVLEADQELRKGRPSESAVTKDLPQAAIGFVGLPVDIRKV